MNNRIYSAVIFLLFFIMKQIASAQFAYISPTPGSSFHNPEEQIILGSDVSLDASLLSSPELFQVHGSVSGVHRSKIQLVDDNGKILLQPDTKFTEGETVSVNIADGIHTKSGATLKGISFTFKIRDPRNPEQQLQITKALRQVYEEDFPSRAENLKVKPPGAPTQGIPDFTILTNTTSSTGDIFFSDFNFYVNDAAYYCIVNNNGDSVFGKQDTVTFNNFELNRNGYLTAYNQHDSDFVMLDSNYKAIGTYQMGNGYKADVHEFLIFPDGTHWMLCYDPQIVDMTVYNPNYNSAATVIGCVFQKLDKNNNVIFQWRSWDHFGILDADHVNFANAIIDDVHSNAIDIDNDGNILLTSRHLSEITKINSSTGDIIWRFGGGSQNQFTFTNDNDKVSWCHDGRRIANGHITVFDNGNYHSPATSYGKEYQLDEVNKTATLVWSFKRTTSQGDIFSKAMGDVQRLPNGNTLICWGLVNTLNNVPKITEVDSANNIVWELQLADQDAVYRALRHNWSPCARPSNSTITASDITSTTAKIKWKPATNASSYDVEYRKVGTITWTAKTISAVSAKIKNLTPSTKYEYQVRSHCMNAGAPLSAWSNIKKFTTAPQRLDSTVSPEISFDIYPNPTSGNLFLNVNSVDRQSLTITIYDASGKLLISQESVNSDANKILINTNMLPNGFYFAEVNSASGNVVKKFVKQ